MPSVTATQPRWMSEHNRLISQSSWRKHQIPEEPKYLKHTGNDNLTLLLKTVS